MEIERKFLLNSLPPIVPYQIMEVYQGYLSTTPEVRISRKEVVDGANKGEIVYFMTVKGEGTLSREEIETTITEEFFNRLSAFIGHPLIHKDYYIYKLNGHTIECSIVDKDSKSWFIYGEVEFDSEEATSRYEWEFRENDPIEVTDDPYFKMKNYWLRTRVDVDERMIKGFDFPTFEEWEKNNRDYSGKLGVFKCAIKVVSWGRDEATYMLAIADAAVPTNVFVHQIIYNAIRVHPDNINELRRWYKAAVQKAQEQWREYIQKTYLS